MHTQPFFEDRAKYFSSLGEEVTVFFPKEEDWSRRDVQQRLLAINKSMEESGHSLALYNGMAIFLEEKGDSLVEGNSTAFNTAYVSQKVSSAEALKFYCTSDCCPLFPHWHR